MDSIIIRIKRPNGYDDVAPELVLADFLDTPDDPAWSPEIIDTTPTE